VAGVSALAYRWTDDSGDFTALTEPTLAQVESWINQVSAMLNVAMAQCRYTTFPITIEIITEMLDGYVNQTVSTICEGRHDIGRLGPTALTNNVTGSVRSMWQVVGGEAATFIKDNCDAFEYLGLERDPLNSSKGRTTTTSTIRADAYSDDLNAIETTGL
jgi:hypothetical protein